MVVDSNVLLIKANYLYLNRASKIVLVESITDGRYEHNGQEIDSIEVHRPKVKVGEIVRRSNTHIRMRSKNQYGTSGIWRRSEIPYKCIKVLVLGGSKLSTTLFADGAWYEHISSDTDLMFAIGSIKSEFVQLFIKSYERMQRTPPGWFTFDPAAEEKKTSKQQVDKLIEPGVVRF